MGILIDRYCIKEGIIVSPIASKPWSYREKDKNKSWYVGVSLPENPRKVFKSPEPYGIDEIWDKVEETKKYYYDKHR